MKKRIIAVTLSLALIFSVLVSLSGCGVSLQATNLMSGVKAKKVNTVADLTGDDSGVIANFAVKLFQNSSHRCEKHACIPAFRAVRPRHDRQRRKGRDA